MKINKAGAILVGIYYLITIMVVIQALTCKSMYCGLILVGPIMPWVFVLEGMVSDSISIYVLMVGLNSLLLYFIGYGLSCLFKRSPQA